MIGEGPATRRRLLIVVGRSMGLCGLAAGVVGREMGVSAQPIGAAGRKGGKAIAREAMRHKGARYVWGGNTPRGFDCSGFTQYVVRKAIGREMGQGLPEQWRTGRRVGKGDWRAGDLVFFENTYKRGLSHVGIYLGKGRFIHAQNEETGVVISDIGSPYYADRYRGARRVA